jgi:hypothetical protein
VAGNPGFMDEENRMNLGLLCAIVGGIAYGEILRPDKDSSTDAPPHMQAQAVQVNSDTLADIYLKIGDKSAILINQGNNHYTTAPSYAQQKMENELKRTTQIKDSLDKIVQ